MAEVATVIYTEELTRTVTVKLPENLSKRLIDHQKSGDGGDYPEEVRRYVYNTMCDNTFIEDAIHDTNWECSV